ncbi:MAG: ATPase, T2SS/T4P/T4SS family [Actinomycetota bacterium]
MARTRLGDILLKSGLLREDQLQHALEQRRLSDGRKPRIESVLVDSGYVSDEQIARTLSTELNLPFIDLATVEVDPELVQLIPQWLADRHQLVPVRRTHDGVMIAMTDPTNLVAIDDVRVAARVGKVSLGVAPVGALRDATERIYSIDSAAAEILNRLGVAADVEVVPEEGDDTGEDLAATAQDSAEMAPIIALTNAVLADAVRGRATDVHIEPQPTQVEVRYRVDGLLREVMTLPKHIQGLVMSRLKILAGMDIAERRRPQDGRSRILVDGREVDTRVSTIPTLSGEKAVIRLLYKSKEKASIETLGFDDPQLETLRQHLLLSQGLIIFTGPTGSGKTSTMYAGLTEMSSSEMNISTLEDPIEYQIPGVNQVQVDEKVGITFARGLRSFLRQDPDVIMVGEVRDVETAQIVMQSSLTGHLVMSSLHTNDAPSAITRLIDIGVEPFLIASALSLVVAQRLVRVICPHCKVPAEMPERTLKLLGLTDFDLAGQQLFKGAGCEQCSYTGYLGRTGIYEVMPITAQLREQIGSQASEAVLTDTVRAAGVMSLREAGLAKVGAGVTTLEEVLRVTYVEQEEIRRCPSCRHEVENSFIVCPYCQTDLTADQCPACAKDVEPEWKICPYCRTDLPLNNEFRAGPRRLLVADDEPSITMLMETLFSDDFEVITAATGEEALRRATIERPDLILLDLNLPDLSGTEVTKRLRNSAATSLIPVIMVTGEADSELESLRAGVDDHVSKPFEEEALRARVENALHRAGQSARSPFAGREPTALRRQVLSPRVENVLRHAQESIRRPFTTVDAEKSVMLPINGHHTIELDVDAGTNGNGDGHTNGNGNGHTNGNGNGHSNDNGHGKAAPRSRKDFVASVPATKKTEGTEPTIRFKISQQATVSVAVYNERGTLVRKLIFAEVMPAGTHLVKWDGKNSSKRNAKAGEYRFEIDAQSVHGTGSATLEGNTTLVR